MPKYIHVGAFLYMYIVGFYLYIFIRGMFTYELSYVQFFFLFYSLNILRVRVCAHIYVGM